MKRENAGPSTSKAFHTACAPLAAVIAAGRPCPRGPVAGVAAAADLPDPARQGRETGGPASYERFGVHWVRRVLHKERILRTVDAVLGDQISLGSGNDTFTINSTTSGTSNKTTLSTGGGTDTVIYRDVTIHQDKGTTCVIDWYQRLALTSHLYSGSSLQSYMFPAANLSGSKKTISGLSPETSMMVILPLASGT